MDQLLNSFAEAGTLMLAGMIFVFAFLGMLVVFIKLVLTPLANKYPDAKPVARKSSGSVTKKSGVDSGTVAAISAAVTQYRNTEEKK